jgi:rubrerythrin
VSRLPRSQEHLKTAFNAEAAAAARFRAYAERSERDGLPNIASRFRELAQAKDGLAQRLLDAAGQVRGAGEDVTTALAEERYENEVLYPRMSEDSDASTAEVFRAVVEAQRGHREDLERLRDNWLASRGDLPGRGGA